MDLRFVREGNNRLEVEILGEDHTIGNYLRASLLTVEGVRQAGYEVIHPLTGGIRVVVVTENGKDPKAAMVEALEKMTKEVEEFREKFKKASP
ncbi:MAG: DNA-directed RNA polymerase subunit L [Candidatus Verstraetearchaeota archaeon]|nr:DNA-directed RNA polymerase subunit L [Candidatus Verstraetearchaeota archaeon]